MIMPILVLGTPVFGIVLLLVIFFVIKDRGTSDSAYLDRMSYFSNSLLIGLFFGGVGFFLGGPLMCDVSPSNLCGLGGLLLAPILFGGGVAVSAIWWLMISKKR